MPKQFAPVGYQFVKFEGGLDVVSNAIEIKGGAMAGCQNFEIDQYGGYSRINGYERFDGHDKPSDQNYTYLAVTFSATVSVGQTVTGLSSSATGKVIAVEDAALILARVTGSWIQGENVQVSGVTKAVTTDGPATGGASTVYNDAVYLNLCADEYRTSIAAVPGSGQIRGVWMFNGVVYAFRNNAGGTACDMYKSSSSGWTQVVFEYEISFTNANTSVGDGDTLTQGGVTATIRRVVLESGTLLSGTNTGRLIISAPAPALSDFAAGAATTTGGGSLNLVAKQTAITLLPSGRFEFCTYNFGAGDRMFGVDGVNKGFEFDGTVFVPISTSMSPDTPKFVLAHKNHLFYAYGRSLQHSGVGTPYMWTLLSGAVEINAGDTITGLVTEPGSADGAAMTLYTRNKTQVLYGSSSADWNLVMLQNDSGALAYSVQKMGSSYCLDDRGINKIGTSQAYGNFEHSVLSRKISPLLGERRFNIACSTIHRFKNQYRIFFTDGYSYSMSVDKDKVLGITQSYFDNVVRVVCTVEDSTGEPLTFFGSDNGFIYEMDKGTSFDGANIVAFVMTPYFHYGTPRTRKRWRSAVIQTKATAWVTAESSFYLGYGSSQIGQEPIRAMQFAAAGSSIWDVANWDDFGYDGVSEVPKNTDISGTSENLACVVSTDSDMIKPFTVSGMLIHFSQRRLSR